MVQFGPDAGALVTGDYAFWLLTVYAIQELLWRASLCS